MSEILIKKSIMASFTISLGVVVLLTIGQPLGPILFAFGLLMVCMFQYNLFTGKCGYAIENNNIKELTFILIVNLIAGWALGALFGYINPTLTEAAALKISSWTDPFIHFIQAFCCGAIMFFAVDTFKKGSVLGILYGIPLFIFCGFQHCIANVIILGMAYSFSPYLILAILGNWCGSLWIWLMTKDCN